MARLKHNGSELLRWQYIIDYPIDHSDCIEQVLKVFSLRSNGYILQKTITISTLFDKPDRFTTNWKRHSKIKDLTRLNIAKDKIVAKIKNFTTKHLSSGATMNISLN